MFDAFEIFSFSDDIIFVFIGSHNSVFLFDSMIKHPCVCVQPIIFHFKTMIAIILSEAKKTQWITDSKSELSFLDRTDNYVIPSSKTVITYQEIPRNHRKRMGNSWTLIYLWIMFLIIIVVLLQSCDTKKSYRLLFSRKLSSSHKCRDIEKVVEVRVLLFQSQYLNW
jgi:hypothetical protein